MEEGTVALLAKSDGDVRHRRLTRLQKAAYGVGHVMNDICAATWFSYTLLFFHTVLGMPPALSGVLLLIGQVADAIATPIVGVYADRIGSRKTWHLVGTGLVVFSFPLIFTPCPGCTSPQLPPELIKQLPENTIQIDTWIGLDVESLWLRGFYYSIPIIGFQAGWAIVQISHLALIPDLTPIQQERVELTAIRYTASVCASVLTYLVTWLVLHVTAGELSDSFGPGDSYKFRDIVLIGIVVGGVFTACFHFILVTPRTYAQVKKQLLTKSQLVPITSVPSSAVVQFRKPTIYLVSILYVASRLYVTVNLVYMPLYLAETLGEQVESLATVPLASYLASFLASLAVKYINPYMTNKVLYLMGGILSVLPCIWIGIGVGYITRTGELYTAAILIGAGSSVTMVSSLCYVADMIGTQTENGAFVYSVVTFADKLLNGIAVMVIQALQCNSREECPNYYRQVLAYVCGGCAILGLVGVCTLWRSPLGNSTTTSLQNGTQLQQQSPNHTHQQNGTKTEFEAEILVGNQKKTNYS